MTSTLSLNTAEPGAGAPLHTHTMDELIVIVEGQLEVRIDGESHLVGKDHTLVIPPGAEHGFKIVGDQPAQLLVFFPTLEPYAPQRTRYLEGAAPSSV